MCTCNVRTARFDSILSYSVISYLQDKQPKSVTVLSKQSFFEKIATFKFARLISQILFCSLNFEAITALVIYYL